MDCCVAWYQQLAHEAACRELPRAFYLANPTKCPYCRGKDIRSEPPQTCDLDIHCEVVCEDCGKTWTDVYKVADVIFPKKEK